MALSQPLVSAGARKAIFVVLPLMYLAGTVGLNIPSVAPLFRLLTPLNLLASLGLLLLFHTDFRPSFWLYGGLAFLVGYFVEVAGVHTGAVFGEYRYGEALGPKVAEVPLIIGVNWLLLSYLCGNAADRLPFPPFGKMVVAAAMMTLLDVVIEPAAIRLGFWQWSGEGVPLQNYLAWFGVSLALFAVFFTLDFRKRNALAPLLLVLQFLFFSVNAIL